MDIHPNEYYHIYNRSNSQETVFKSRDNYLYFLEKYRGYFDGLLKTLGYCLMPTHFHFLVQVCTEDVEDIKKKIGIWLSSYTRAINKSNERTGSLFQQHTQAKHIDEERYLVTLITYIHQNPVRAKLAPELEAWEYSSYLDYIGVRDGSLPV